MYIKPNCPQPFLVHLEIYWTVELEIYWTAEFRSALLASKDLGLLLTPYLIYFQIYSKWNLSAAIGVYNLIVNSIF